MIRWLKPDQTKWTDWSHHDKTNLNYANEIDLNAKFWFLKQKNYRIAMMSGYQRNNSSWTAYGGNYNYDNGKSIFTTSDTVTVIGYKQKFDMTYLGPAGSYHYQKFEFNTLLKYSRWVNANGHDEHYSRKLSFKDSNKNSRYYAIVVDAGYYITPSTKLFVEATGTSTPKVKEQHKPSTVAPVHLRIMLIAPVSLRKTTPSALVCCISFNPSPRHHQLQHQSR